MTGRMSIRVALIVMLAMSAVVSTSLLPQATPAAWAQASVLEEVQQLYNSARFDDAVTKLRDALASGQVSGPEALKAKEWLGRCLAKAGNRVEAKEAFKSLLRQDAGYRLDAVTVPPDEMEVFDLALKEITAEQIEAGQRVPASIGVSYGIGTGTNDDFMEIVEASGGSDDFENKPLFGGSVRFPLKPRLSLDIELMRLRATNQDTLPAPNNTEFEITALPLVVSLYYTALPASKYRVNVFAGAGPMLASRSAINFQFFTARLSLADEKVGFYGHAGVEGEYLFSPRFSIAGRVFGRAASASGLFEDTDLTFYSVPLKDRDVSFSGVGANLTLRAYIGY